jgi:2-isopropylmalate synthase
VNRAPFQFQPFVGYSAFSHKGGLHAAATQKSVQAYQHIEPSLVGNSNDVVISELSGRGNIVHRIKEMGLQADLDDADARRIVQHVKDQESKGFSYEGANASFDLVLRKALPNYEAPFELVDFMVIVENKRRSSFGTGWRNDGEEHPLLSEATVKVRVGEEVHHTAAEGDGPVGALDGALRKSLVDAYPELSAIRLTDYKVRVVNEGVGTGAVVRVVIESADDKDVWYTVGASSNILEASWLALTDSFEWWLFQNSVLGG